MTGEPRRSVKIGKGLIIVLGLDLLIVALYFLGAF